MIGDDDPLWADWRGNDVTTAMHELDAGDLDPIADDAVLDRVCEAFANLIDAKSPFTARHSRGVAAAALLVGEALGITPGERRQLRRAGLLHDIGKLGVANSILDKPGKLTDAEFAEVKRHPALTAEILGVVAAFAPFAEIAAAHHERLDGRGYHRGIPAGDLCVGARALAVADVFDALTAERPYRQPLDPDEALVILEREAGSHLCPVCVAALRGGIDQRLPRAA